MSYGNNFRTSFTQGEDKCLSQEKPVAVDPLKSPGSLKGHTGKPVMNNMAESFATISRINIDILPGERRNSANDNIVQETQPRQSDASDEVDSQFSISQDRKERFRGDTKSSDQPDSLLPRRSSDDCDGEGNELVVKDQKPDQVSDTHLVFREKKTASMLQRCKYGAGEMVWCLLLLQWAWVWFPAPPWWLITICNSRSRRS